MAVPYYREIKTGLKNNFGYFEEAKIQIYEVKSVAYRRGFRNVESGRLSSASLMYV